MWMLFERGNGSDSSLRPKLGLHTHEFTSILGAHNQIEINLGTCQPDSAKHLHQKHTKGRK